MRRFFFDPEKRNGETVVLSREESYHLVKVLRLQRGAGIVLLDGLGTVYSAVVAATGHRAEVCIEGILSREKKEGNRVWVGQGILKGEKMDNVVQKCTELGIARMTPFRSSRCQGKLSTVQSHKKHERWQRIGLAACKQCLRSRPLKLDIPVLYSEWLRDVSGDKAVRLLFWEEEKKTRLQDITNIGTAQSIILLMGPEGGFSPDEVEQARGLGWCTVSLGKRILRAETATLTAVSIVQYLAGNL